MMVANGMATKNRGSRIRALPLAAASAVFLCLATQDAAAETRSFAFNWFYPAMYTQPDNCPDGVNPRSCCNRSP